MAMLGAMVPLFVLACIVLLGLLAAIPGVSDAIQRAERHRLVVEASWRLHQQAAAAFSDMLDVARQTQISEDKQCGEESS